MKKRIHPSFSHSYEIILQDTVHFLLALFHKNPSHRLIKETLNVCYDSIIHVTQPLTRQLQEQPTEKIEFQLVTDMINEIYYDEKEDQSIIDMYYKNLPLDDFSNDNLVSELTELLTRTHNPQLSYSTSRKALHSWVDLREDGQIKSIYSDQSLNPSDVIAQDKLLEDAAIDQMIQVLSKDFGVLHEHKNILIESVLRSLQFNIEHVIPQSWFEKRHPMVGDLHHLFTCEKDCNSFRSNIPYYDFEDYKPGAYKEVIKSFCGKRDGNQRFEPENGKGEIARACLYFLMRYPDEIIQEKMSLIDIDLYKKWHNNHPVSLHEKHRNWAIFKLQGNRNPYIDFPELDFT
ncbi:endonuclease I family protein [Bacillus sp. D386]|uniref:endonuclease I family protein n=1 Tax=Bacillus sp. D386 TaxID=2587155 RepID=UPI00111F9298|nr:endonuclease [Bacillus sp. D386]